jgi:hypothetical protein
MSVRVTDAVEAYERAAEERPDGKVVFSLA